MISKFSRLSKKNARLDSTGCGRGSTGNCSRNWSIVKGLEDLEIGGREKIFQASN